LGDSAAAGSSTGPARANHVHGREAFAAQAELSGVGSAFSAGSNTTVPRSDHVHTAPQHARVTGRTTALVGGTPPAAGTGPWLEQFGSTSGSLSTAAPSSSDAEMVVSFPTAFPNGVVTVTCTCGNGTIASDLTVSIVNTTTTNFTVHVRSS